MIGNPIETFADASMSNVSAEVVEDILTPSDDEKVYIVHEIKLSVGMGQPLIIWNHELDAILGVLRKAQELCRRRTEEFNAKQASPTTP